MGAEGILCAAGGGAAVGFELGANGLNRKKPQGTQWRRKGRKGRKGAQALCFSPQDMIVDWNERVC